LDVLSGTAIGSSAGYKSLVETQADVLSAIVVTPNVDEGVRIKDGGGADVYLRTTITVESLLTYTYSVGETYRNLPTKPVISVNAVREGSTFLVEGIDYRVSLDTGVYARSIYSIDRIFWITSRTSGEILSIYYTYSSATRSIQDLLDQSDKHAVGIDILAKLAYYATVDIDLIVELLPGYTASVVRAAVVTALTSYINGLHLGDDVQQSDVIAEVENVIGVDSVVLPLTIFTVTREISGVTDSIDEIEGISTGATTGNLQIRKYEYPIAGTISASSYIEEV
ncbi:hypothetical protein KKF61_08315, partial [Patescibacteria group bacterium]|nr:hypothetical protein [Patescibacteria group bacterium]